MGHRVSSKQAYLDLQTRLDRNVTGAPSSPTFIKILKLLYSPREAELVAHLPTIPTSVETLARRLDMPAPELDANRGELYNLPFNMNTFAKMWGVTTPAEAAAKIAEQRKEIGSLQRDEKQLTQLIARLNRIIATRPAPRKEIPSQTAPGKRPEKQGGRKQWLKC